MAANEITAVFESFEGGAFMHVQQSLLGGLRRAVFEGTGRA
jgi:hypothetical protein